MSKHRNWVERHVLGFYNEGVHKVISIFGLKIKIKLNRLVLEQQKQQLEQQVQKVAGLYYYSEDCINLRVQYEKKISNIIRSNRTIRVVFLVRDSCKWAYDSLYKKLENTNRFEPIIAVRTIQLSNTDLEMHTFNFFKLHYSNVYLCNNESDLMQLSPDIVFYEQPWVLLPYEQIDNVAKFALTCYCSYSAAGTPSDVLDYTLKEFDLKLWKYFISSTSEEEFTRLFSYNGMNLVKSGHPKLDFWLKKENEKKNKKNYVIFAPHFSFESTDILKYGTFRWSGVYMLNFAKLHSEFNWVFKPHPGLKQWLLNSEEFRNQAEDYYKEWERIAVYLDTGNYLDYFKDSLCLITDCSSFLTEYFFSERPVIHLRSELATSYTKINREIMVSYYKAYDLNDLSRYLEQILIKKEDPKRIERIKIMNKLSSKTSASQYICDYLRRQLQ